MTNKQKCGCVCHCDSKFDCEELHLTICRHCNPPQKEKKIIVICSGCGEKCYLYPNKKGEVRAFWDHKCQPQKKCSCNGTGRGIKEQGYDICQGCNGSGKSPQKCTCRCHTTGCIQEECICTTKCPKKKDLIQKEGWEDIEYYGVKTNPIIDKLVNAFIENALPDLYAHYTDDDENAGQLLRVQLSKLLATQRQKVEEMIEGKLEWHKHNSIPNLTGSEDEKCITCMKNKVLENILSQLRTKEGEKQI